MIDGEREKNLKRALLFVAPHKGALAIVMCMTLTVAALGAVEPLVMKYIFDKLGTKVTATLLTGVAMLIGLNVAREAIGGVSNWLTWRVRLDINYELLDAIVGRLHSLPMTFHREETVGGIMTKLDKGINGLVSALSEVAFNIFPGLVYLIISLIVMFRLDFRLSLIVLFFTPIPALIGMWAAGEQTERDKTLLEKWTSIFSRFNEVLSGIVTVKSFASEEREKSRFTAGVRAANSLVLKGVGLDTGVGATKNIIGMLAKVLSLGVGGWLVIQGEITAGTLVAFLGYSGGLFGPVQNLTGVYQTLRRAAVSLDTVYSILDAKDSITDHPEAKTLHSVEGRVSFEGVSFSYKREIPILTNINLDIRPGETIALVGPSGAGKTTLVALIQRLYDPGEGVVRIDGMDIKELNQRWLRKNIGVVSQDALLFNDTVRNNIAYGRPESSIREITDAARAANALGFITKLPEGFNTLIGERGGRLSAGERQRLSIARALIKDPPILILDEATSALDAESESLVQDAMSCLMKGRTTFVIAHRLSTVVNADRILVLKDGGIVEEGSHSELVRAEGYYASLVECQTRGLLIDAA